MSAELLTVIVGCLTIVALVITGLVVESLIAPCVTGIVVVTIFGNVLASALHR